MEEKEYTLTELIDELHRLRDALISPKAGIELGAQRVFVKVIHPNGSFQVRGRLKLMDCGNHFMIEARR